MKNLAFLLLLFAGNVFAQKDDIFRIDKLPKQGITLDKGWKFHAGDALEWANPNFDDSDWDTLHPSTLFAELPQLTTAEIGWFRLPVQVDSAFINQPLILDVTPMGALEIYLNGNLVHQVGKVSQDPNLEVTYAEGYNPCNFVFSRPENNVIAVRYSLTKSNFYFKDNHPFSLLLRKLDGYTEEWKAIIGNSIFRRTLIAGFYLMMAILHLSFYFFYPAQRANLLFSLALLVLGISSLIRISHGLWLPQVTFFNAKIVLSQILAVTSELLLLAAVYVYFRRPFGFFFKGILVLYAFYMAARLGYHVASAGIGSMLIIGILLNYMYVSYWAMQENNRSARFIFYGGITSFILLSVNYLLDFYKHEYNYPGEWAASVQEIMVVISSLSIPVSISLALARDFAQTSYSLQRNLEEVKQLSAEKQNILSIQNEMLERQVNERTAALKQSIETLKATQSQLVQSEKLASLGELTAGIAHEIQNPLNFVNNFSEISIELIEELNEERKKENRDLELEAELLNDLSQNQQKINHHGKRAASIVTGMLQHARTSSGTKEPTDVNALAEEYLRLSYHGLRAKDATFNAKMVTDFDPTVGQVALIPQDIGRVLLNLINNAFYAVAQKKNQNPALAYEPTVTVSSRLSKSGKVEIRIKDNGTGIPDSVKAKIFQPFFTTKPTGQGTGLGLSLAYDIVTKGHGGKLKVETEAGEGTEFIIRLPK